MPALSKKLNWLLIAASLPGWCAVSFAQGFPTHPVRIVAATPPGGAADVNARLLSERLARKWKQPVVVQNSAGVAGSVAAVTVAEATPDGYTLLFVAHPVLAVNPLLYKKLPFNAERDFVPVVLLTRMPHVLLVNPALPAATVGEFIALAKAKPGTLNYGSGGAGSSTHLASELLADAASIDLRHVPYRGAAPAVTALISGEIQFLFDATITAIGHLRGGRVRGIAIASMTRSAVLPDIPTFDESGILAPSKVAPATLAQLNRDLNETLGEPEYKKRMAEFGADLVGGSGKEFQAFLAAENKKWAAVIKKRGINAE